MISEMLRYFKLFAVVGVVKLLLFISYFLLKVQGYSKFYRPLPNKIRENLSM